MTAQFDLRNSAFGISPARRLAVMNLALRGIEADIGQVIRSSSSVAANYRSACRGKSKADFIAKLGTVEEEADETGFCLEMLRDIAQRRRLKLEAQASQELTRLLDEANQLVAITVASRKTARGDE